MLKVEHAMPYHMKLIRPKEAFKLEGNWRARLAAQIERSPGFTIFQKGWPVAIFGASFLNRKVIQIWAVTSPEMTKYPITMHRLCAKLLREYRHAHGIHRAQITIRPDFPRAVEWALALGFSYEGKLVKYGEDGSDFLLFSKVF